MSYLKPYQEDCVRRLGEYFHRCRELGDARLAFVEDRDRGEYEEPEGLEGVPYVCLKVPTGGGKTAIAAHAVRPMLEVLGQRDAGPVLWLAPSDPIVNQTLEALKDRQHPYRQALDRAFEGAVTVCDLESALYLQRDKLESDCVIIVCTVQVFRQELEQKVKGKKEVIANRPYRVNGQLKHHFDNLSPVQREALFKQVEDGEDPTCPTLANVLKMHRPAVVMDEAHNARTDLSFKTLQRFGPSCILELTATPADDSNVLHSVSAAVLKEAQMIKLPVVLRARRHARDAVRSAVEKRKELAELAKAEQAEKGYVRPIVLYQAQTGDNEFNVHGVKKILVDEIGLDPDRVAICTGSVDELPDLHILDPENPVEHIITVQKLREGWDCPFAYVLCSVGNLGSRTAVEQMLGRVLRMPYAKRRNDDDLNKAYCYATSEDFRAAADDLEAALVENCGFEKHEARRMVRREPEPASPRDGGPTLYDEAPQPVSLRLAGAVDENRLAPEIKTHVTVQPTRDGGSLLTWSGGAMDETQQRAVQTAITDSRDELAAARLRKRSWSEDDAPANLGVSFKVPAMAVKEQGAWFVLDDQPLEGEWSLRQQDAALSESSFRVREDAAQGAMLDADERGGVRKRFFDDLDQQVKLFEPSGLKTPAELANWIDRRIRETSLPAADKRDFILRSIEGLMAERNLDLGTLIREKHRLKDVLSSRIAALRINAERQTYQHLLDGDGFGVSMDCRLSFPAAYPADKLCSANIDWQRHYYADVAAMNDAELKVAEYLDSLPMIRHWVRNLEGPHHVEHAFWLRRPRGRFFPDFVAELFGDQYLVVEYKGGDRESADEQQEKKRTGELWAAEAPEQLQFVWALAETWQEKIDDAIEKLTGHRPR